MGLNDSNLLDEAFETALGRRAPFTMVSDWVLLSGASPDALSLYWGLSAHINVTRNNTEVWPGLLTLARLLHLKKPEQVARYLLELEVIRAVEVHRSTAGLVRRNRYVVHQTPPPGYPGPLSLGEWYGKNRGPAGESKEHRLRREEKFDAWLDTVRSALKTSCQRIAEERKQARQARRPEPPVTLFHPPRLEDFRTPMDGGTERPAKMFHSSVIDSNAAGQAVPPSAGVRGPLPRGDVPPRKGVEEDEVQQKQQTDEPAPSARSAADARRATTGSKARTKITQSSPDPKLKDAAVRMSREQAVAVRTVEESFPADLQALLPKYRPLVLRDAILAALRWRTADQLAQRVERRWYTWGFAAKADVKAGGEGLASPVGVAVKLVGDGDCRAPRCEDGLDIDTGGTCPRCEERLADRTRLPRPRPNVTQHHVIRREGPIPVAQQCLDCGLGMIHRTGDGLCGSCRALRGSAPPSLPPQPPALETCTGLGGVACDRNSVLRGLCRHCLAASLCQHPEAAAEGI